MWGNVLWSGLCTQTCNNDYYKCNNLYCFLEEATIGSHSRNPILYNSCASALNHTTHLEISHGLVGEPSMPNTYLMMHSYQASYPYTWPTLFKLVQQSCCFIVLFVLAYSKSADSCHVSQHHLLQYVHRLLPRADTLCVLLSRLNSARSVRRYFSLASLFAPNREYHHMRQ
jgi:hypothetical protein